MVYSWDIANMYDQYMSFLRVKQKLQTLKYKCGKYNTVVGEM